jgi:AraC family transcriptional regulator, transcriptional activator of pobA
MNIYRIADLCTGEPVQHGRRDYYKISLIRGPKIIHYPDVSFEITTSTLVFFKPGVPYSMTQTGTGHTGVFCVFPESYFSNYVNIDKYPLFKDISNAYLPLNASQDVFVAQLFDKIEIEFKGDYEYRDDIIRNYILDLIHFIMREKKFAPVIPIQTGSSRIANLFKELLEKQFPIDSIGQQLTVRNPKDFAGALNVHVNHLNKALQEVTGKTTTELIKERIIKEARAMLRFTDWTISQIAWCLGYEDTSNFINLFKKATATTPNDFRRHQPV